MDKSTHCVESGCEAAAYAKRLCKAHYNQDYYRRTTGAKIAAEAQLRVSLPPVTEKACTRCSTVKPLESFNVSSRNQATGREPVCKSCRHDSYLIRREEAQARQREYYWRNRDQIRTHKAQWWLDNRDVGRSRNASSHEKFKESRNAASAARRGDPEYAAGARRRTVEWRRANPDRARVQDLLRNRRLRAAGRIPFTEAQLAARVAYFGGKCWMCRGPFENLDHVKPVSLGGITTLSNLRPACVSCNSLKRARWYGPQEVHRFIRT